MILDFIVGVAASIVASIICGLLTKKVLGKSNDVLTSIYTIYIAFSAFVFVIILAFMLSGNLQNAFASWSGQNAFTADLPEDLQLNIKGARISQIYKRLDPSKPSYTVTGSGGGGTHIYHWAEPRALTNRERARLQTFPDTYEFQGSKESVRKQIGMAVPCEGAKIIFEAILKCFAGVEYPYVEANINE